MLRLIEGWLLWLGLAALGAAFAGAWHCDGCDGLWMGMRDAGCGMRDGLLCCDRLEDC